MGYTHYWRINPIRGKAKEQEAQYKEAIKQCQKIIFEYNKAIKSINEKDYRRLSGYTAHTKPSTYGGIHINGVQKYGHEDFVLREHFKENRSFEFCKTARKPYDIPVTACLTVLKHYMGEGIEVSSDGDHVEWVEGVELAEVVTGLKLKNPIPRDRDYLELLK